MLGNEETPVVETGVPQPVDMLETVTAAVKLEQKTSQEPVKNEVLNAPPKQDEDMDFELDIPDELLTGMDLDVTMPTAVAPMAPVEKKKFEYAQPKVQTSAPSTSTFVQAP